MNNNEELVDILEPSTFKKSGQVKTLLNAWKDENWIGTFNLWILQSNPISSIVYQKRSPRSSWAPNLLDVSAGGHYSSGENVVDGLREVHEELGKQYEFNKLKFIGRKINLSRDINSHLRHNLVDIFFVIDNSELSTYKLLQDEVYSICACSIKELIKVHEKRNYSFEVENYLYNGAKEKLMIDVNSFPFNWDNYHYKIALLAKRFLYGDKDIIY